MLHSFLSPSFCVISALGTWAGVSDERGSFQLEHRATVSLFLCLSRKIDSNWLRPCWSQSKVRNDCGSKDSFPRVITSVVVKEAVHRCNSALCSPSTRTTILVDLTDWISATVSQMYPSHHCRLVPCAQVWLFLASLNKDTTFMSSVDKMFFSICSSFCCWVHDNNDVIKVQTFSF